MPRITIPIRRGDGGTVAGGTGAAGNIQNKLT
jgi:hypothetical protein